MKKLKFPSFKEPLPRSPHLSMTQYAEFIRFNWMYVVDREAVRKQKLKDMPKEPFRLK